MVRKIFGYLCILTLVQTSIAYNEQSVEGLKEQIKKPKTAKWCCSRYDISYANREIKWPLDLSGINLKEAKLGGNAFGQTDFSGTDLAGASFEGDKKNITDLTQSLLYFAKNITTALCNEYTKLPEGFGRIKRELTKAEERIPKSEFHQKSIITIDPDVQELLQAAEKAYHTYASNEKVITRLKSSVEKNVLSRKLQYDIISWAISYLKNTAWEQISTDDAQALKRIVQNMVQKAYWVLRAFVIGEQKEYSNVEQFINNLKAITARIFKDVALLYRLSAKQYDVTVKMSPEIAKKLRALAHDIVINTAPTVHDIGKPGNVRRAMWFFMLKPEWNYPENHYMQDSESLLNREEWARNLLKGLPVVLPKDFGVQKS